MSASASTTPPGPERRTIKLDLSKPIELRAAADGKSAKIIGYGAVFNSLSEDLGGFREKIRPGFFSKAIRDKHDVRGLFNHDSNMILGRTKSGTMTLTEDDHGLRYEIDVPDTTVGRDLKVSLERKDVDGSSFSFTTQVDDVRNEGGVIIRELIEIKQLYDVGPVAFPAYSASSAEARSADEIVKRAKTPEDPRDQRSRDRLRCLEAEAGVTVPAK